VSLYQQWLDAKQMEAHAIQARRAVEDQLVKQFKVPDDLDGTTTEVDGGYKIKIDGRINRKINSEKLQELAIEHGLTEHLSSLFRWKPEIAMTAWKAADKKITTPLLDAITATPGRPSFTITLKE
jgi:hypothetical protein